MFVQENKFNNTMTIRNKKKLKFWEEAGDSAIWGENKPYVALAPKEVVDTETTEMSPVQAITDQANRLIRVWRKFAAFLQL